MGSIGGVETSSLDDTPDDYGRWMLHGPQGSGKSTLASTIAELGPCLFIDLNGEKGVRSFKGAPYADNIEIARPTSITKLDDIFWALDKGGHGYKSTVIDSVTSVGKMGMRFLMGHSETAVREIRMGTAPAQIQTWGQNLDILTDVATFWYGLADGNRPEPMHVVMTAQTLIAEEVQPGGAKETRRMPDVQKGARSVMMSAPDYIVYCDFEDDDEAFGDDSKMPVRLIARFGPNPEYRTKARIPINLRGKMPPVLGRKNPPSLAQLSRVLGIGGAPAPITKAKATVAAATTKDGE